MNKMFKNKEILSWGIIWGILLIVIGFIYDVIFAGIPYQDPTPLMIKKFNFHKTVAEKIELIGFVIMLISLLGVIIKKFIKPIRNV